MRTLFVLFFFTTWSFVQAATDLSPILDSQTLAVVRVDLNQVDIPKIAAFFNEELKEIIPQFEPDKVTADQMLFMGQAGITYVVATVSPVVNSFRNDGKANEIFLILDKTARDERICPFFIAIPAKPDKPKAEVDTIRKLLLQNQCPVTFHRHGFVVGIPMVPDYAEKDEITDFVRTRFAEPSSEKRPEFAEALDATTAGSLIQFVVGNLSVFDQEMENMTKGIPAEMLEDMPPEMKTNRELSMKVYNLLWKKMNFISVTLDLNKPEFKVEMRMEDATSALEICDALERIMAYVSQLVASEGDDYFLAYWYLDGIHKAFDIKVSGKSMTTSVDAVKYKILKKELTQTLPKLLSMRYQEGPDF